MRTRRIPGGWPGILLFFAAARLGAAGADLAQELFDEGRWAECARESRRVLLSDPRNETAALHLAVARLRLGGTDEEPLAALTSARDPEIRARAAYELGRLNWAAGDPAAAYPLLRQAFLETRSQPLSLRSGCSLNELLRAFPNLGKDDLALVQSLETCRPLWSRALRAECAAPRARADRGGWLSAPGKWLVSFYRTQIRPAIGARCSLEPSCSAYFLAASRAHGLLGLPMMADRLVREPSVVAEARRPVPGDGAPRFADPVSDHDFWFHGGGGN
ncbi:MAG TPA: membrane protein insertion efficiency factor YidD [Kiritimatiellia bacterium]|nr:membrane protein insertion efficiency factor YidD [Kiritimatiellia bacterium]HRZ11436.1 membrane protein insertion efficiency factor YidD [Kiritimatiellia bacterium]HSA17013.1 membrane protein insertion efficiency factor YidD [Kiritimatiellia bacterium]